MTDQVKKCEVVTEPSQTSGDTIAPILSLECGQSYVAYESLFRNTRVTGTLSVSVSAETACTFTVVVESNDEPDIIRSIAPTDTNRTINLTVNCLKKITFYCAGTGGNFCDFFYSLLLHWCKCC